MLIVHASSRGDAGFCSLRQLRFGGSMWCRVEGLPCRAEVPPGRAVRPRRTGRHTAGIGPGQRCGPSVVARRPLSGSRARRSATEALRGVGSSWARAANYYLGTETVVPSNGPGCHTAGGDDIL